MYPPIVSDNELARDAEWNELKRPTIKNITIIPRLRLCYTYPKILSTFLSVLHVYMVVIRHDKINKYINVTKGKNIPGVRSTEENIEKWNESD